MYRSPTIIRRVALVTAATVALGACGGSDDASSTTVVTTSAPATTAAPTTARPDTTVPSTTAAPTTAPTTPAPTTAAPTTAAPTTAPATTEPTPPTTDSDTSIPDDDDMVLAQFCFDSEQVYVFNQIATELTEPTPAQAEASLSILDFAVTAATESAPAGIGTEPQRASELLAEMIALFEAYDYDVDAVFESPELQTLEEILIEFEEVMGDLTGFVEAECTTASDVLDSQGVKLAPIIDQLRVWPLQPIANQAGDIRLFVPPEWAEWIGSTDVEAITVLEASNSIEQFENTWNAPGVLATVAYVDEGEAAADELLELSSAAPDCTLDATEPYLDAVYVGELHLFSDCAGVGTDAAVLAVTDQAAESVEITLEFQFPGGYERELLDQMLATFAAGA